MNNDRCDIHFYSRSCDCFVDEPLPEWERELLMSEKDLALRELNKAVARARRAGLIVEAKITETVTTTL